MSKILLCADQHIASHKKSVDRLKHCIEALDWIFRTAKDKGVKDIIFLGDLFHDRQKIDVMAYQWTFEIFRKYIDSTSHHDCPHAWLLLGNHDLFHHQKTDISSVRPLDAISNVHIIDKPCTIPVGGRNISFLPYTHDPIDDIYKLENENKDDFRILCGHLAVHNATLNNMWQTKAEVSVEYNGDMVLIEPNTFGAWDQVFLGHYHAAQVLEKVEYIGSRLQLSFGEANTEKHILIYDMKTQEREYVINDFSPKHYVIPIEDVDKYDVGNNFIRFMVDDITGSNIVEMKQELAMKNPGSVEFYEKPKTQQDQQLVDQARDFVMSNDIVEDFVNATEDTWKTAGLDRTKLIEFGNRIRAKRK